jgi:excisionase family DNA binding protein
VTARDDMAAVGLRILDLLTMSEAGLRLGCSADTVARLAGEGELERVRFGALVRITPESVAAYEQQLAAGKA